jgi:small subunit ribosomal protein S6
MASSPTLYDLVLLLSTSSEDERRSQIRSDVESIIEQGGGSIEHRQEWGRRPMTYRINHEGEAEYDLLQFSAPPAGLESLSHNLHIADGVLRFRIIKVLPGTPAPPESAPPLVGVTSATAPTANGGQEESGA